MKGVMTMKFWEALKELDENPMKQFSLVGKKSVILKFNEYNQIDLENINYIETNDEWERIEIPMGFIDAIRSGGLVRVEHDLISDDWKNKTKDYKTLSDLLAILVDNLIDHDLNIVIKYGSWYAN